MQCFAEGVVGTAFFAHGESRRTGTLLGENLNHSGKRTRAIDRALRPARYFDSIDVVRRQIGKIKLTGQSLINRDPVEQDLHVLARQSAHKNGSELAGCAGLNHSQSRHFSKRVRNTLDLFIIDVL